MIPDNWLHEILFPCLSHENISEIEANFEKYKDKPLSELGIDSLNTFSIILNIEKFTKQEIDILNVDGKSFSSLKKIKEYIYEKNWNTSQY